jgi:hypothetical protein
MTQYMTMLQFIESVLSQHCSAETCLSSGLLLLLLLLLLLYQAGLENRDYGRRGSAELTMRHPSIRRSWH